MALLDGLGGMGGGQIDPMQLMQMLQMSQKDPFTRSLPGDALLGGDNMQGGGGQMPGMPGMDMQNPSPNQGMSSISTDFADTQPGLPNLPDSFKGFGFGQYAPQEHQANPRQQLIQQLMQMLPQLNGMGGGNNGGMGGF